MGANIRTSCSITAQFRTLFLIITLPVLLTACAAKPISTLSSQEKSINLAKDTPVLVLTPRFDYERLEDEVRLEASAFHGGLMEQSMHRFAENLVKSREMVKVKAATRKKLLDANLSTDIRKKIPRLVRGIFDAESKDLLKAMAAHEQSMVVLLSYVRVLVGKRGTWDPNSGAITASSSRSLFESVLVECETARVLWRGQVLLRDMPDINSDRLKETFGLLYSNLPAKEG